jgi:hypothetical protein
MEDLVRAYLYGRSLFLAGRRVLRHTRSRRVGLRVPWSRLLFVEEKQGLPEDWPIRTGLAGALRRGQTWAKIR